MWLWEPVYGRLRDKDSGAEHGSVQRWEVVRWMLSDSVRRHTGPPVVSQGHLHHYHSHQLLPAQLQPPERQRGVVQSPEASLRHVSARFRDHRQVQGRNRAYLLPEVSSRVQQFTV